MADCGFSKSSRLLNASDYKTVFDNAQFKVSCRQFLVLATSNHSPRSRLGLVIAKKHVSTAVQRNRIKRLIRDSFRHVASEIPSLDLVVLARNDADKLDSKQIAEKINSLWIDLCDKCLK